MHAKFKINHFHFSIINYKKNQHGIINNKSVKSIVSH